jgi:hypothetical protein
MVSVPKHGGRLAGAPHALKVRSGSASKNAHPAAPQSRMLFAAFSLRHRALLFVAVQNRSIS